MGSKNKNKKSSGKKDKTQVDDEILEEVRKPK